MRWWWWWLSIHTSVVWARRVVGRRATDNPHLPNVRFRAKERFRDSATLPPTPSFPTQGCVSCTLSAHAPPPCPPARHLRSRSLPPFANRSFPIVIQRCLSVPTSKVLPDTRAPACPRGPPLPSSRPPSSLCAARVSLLRVRLRGASSSRPQAHAARARSPSSPPVPLSRRSCSFRARARAPPCVRAFAPLPRAPASLPHNHLLSHRRPTRHQLASSAFSPRAHSSHRPLAFNAHPQIHPPLLFPSVANPWSLPRHPFRFPRAPPLSPVLATPCTLYFSRFPALRPTSSHPTPFALRHLSLSLSPPPSPPSTSTSTTLHHHSPTHHHPALPPPPPPTPPPTTTTTTHTHHPIHPSFSLPTKPFATLILVGLKLQSADRYAMGPNVLSRVDNHMYVRRSNLLVDFVTD